MKAIYRALIYIIFYGITVACNSDNTHTNERALFQNVGYTYEGKVQRAVEETLFNGQDEVLSQPGEASIGFQPVTLSPLGNGVMSYGPEYDIEGAFEKGYPVQKHKEESIEQLVAFKVF